MDWARHGQRMDENAMTAEHVWDLGTIYAVGRLYSAVFVSDETKARAAMDVMGSVRERLAKQVREAARPWAVEVDLGDIRFREQRWQDTPDDERATWPPFTSKVTGWWEPRTREVVLRGGRGDGEVLVVRDPWTPLMIAEPVTVDFASPAPEMVGPTAKTIAYTVSGWSERSRRWVMSPT